MLCWEEVGISAVNSEYILSQHMENWPCRQFGMLGNGIRHLYPAKIASSSYGCLIDKARKASCKLNSLSQKREPEMEACLWKEKTDPCLPQIPNPGLQKAQETQTSIQPLPPWRGRLYSYALF